MAGLWVERTPDEFDSVHALMNNCYSDYGILSAKGLADLLGVF